MYNLKCHTAIKLTWKHTQPQYTTTQYHASHIQIKHTEQTAKGITYLTKSSRRSIPMFSLLVISSRQMRTLIVAVVGVGVFLLKQGSPVWLQQGSSPPPHCIPSHRGSLVCHVYTMCMMLLLFQTHSSSCCQHTMEDWYLVVCCMDNWV